MPEVGKHPQAAVGMCVIEKMRMRALGPPRLFQTLDNRRVGMATGHRPIPEVPFKDLAAKQNLDAGVPARGFDTSEDARQAIGRSLDVLEKVPAVVQQRASHAMHPVVDHSVNHQVFNFGVGESTCGGTSIDEGL